MELPSQAIKFDACCPLQGSRAANLIAHRVLLGQALLRRSSLPILGCCRNGAFQLPRGCPQLAIFSCAPCGGGAVLNLARLQIRADQGTPALKLLEAMHQAISHHTDLTIGEHVLPTANLTGEQAERRKLREWVWLQVIG
ncbi:hypothetical protein [Allorhizocola rhizosphaerae]|uniref:hypothetical protein n=1 Tax=Allorhizocola rhizosphaerae TaxID=1872709 RepID=UPI001FE62233|nr:hypothetical protein [Allorhizocola rhizosphaerae]